MYKLKEYPKTLLFLLWFDPQQKNKVKWTIGIAVFVFGIFLGAPFDNVPYLYNLTKAQQIQLREAGVILSFALFASIFLLFWLKQHKKYKHLPELTDDELDNYMEHMGDNS